MERNKRSNLFGPFVNYLCVKCFIKFVVQLVNNARYTSNDKLSSISDRLWSATNDKFSNRRYDDFLSGTNFKKLFKDLIYKVLL
jgi:hypothetical protein